MIKFLDQNYIKITMDDSLNMYTINSIYEQNNPAVWGYYLKDLNRGTKLIMVLNLS